MTQAIPRSFSSILLLSLAAGLMVAPVAAQEEPAVEQVATEAQSAAEETAEQAAAQVEPVAEQAAAQAPAAEPAPAAPQMAQAQKVFRSSSTVILDGKAEVNGVLTLIFQPNGGEPKQVRVNVTARTNAKKIGKELANQFAFTVGSDYKVKGSGNKVIVKAKNKKVAPFWIGIDQQALTGVAVRVTKG